MNRIIASCHGDNNNDDDDDDDEDDDNDGHGCDDLPY